MEKIRSVEVKKTPETLGALFLEDPTAFRRAIRKEGDGIKVRVDISEYNDNLNRLGRKAKAFLEGGEKREIVFVGTAEQKRQIEANVFDSGVEFEEK